MDQSVSNLREINENEFASEVLGAEVPVLVDFWAEWCGPCKALGPVIASLADQYADRALVAKVDVDANQGLAMQSGIRSIPTVLLFSGGEVVESFVGVRPRGDYEAALGAALNRPIA